MKLDNPDIRAIAVPVMVKGRVVACINMLWIPDVMEVEVFARKYLRLLKRAAKELADVIDEKGVEIGYSPSR
ncbi:MAG: hypothetical protein Kow006_30220 [Gammaproteobacteria bacterium]